MIFSSIIRCEEVYTVYRKYIGCYDINHVPICSSFLNNYNIIDAFEINTY